LGRFTALFFFCVGVLNMFGQMAFFDRIIEVVNDVPDATFYFRLDVVINAGGALCIQIPQQRALAGSRRTMGKIDGGCGLAHTTLDIEHRDRGRHAFTPALQIIDIDIDRATAKSTSL